MPDLQSVFADHHGVDARHRTVMALSCQICSQCSQTITAWTRDTERCTNQNPELNENESDPDFLCVTIACPSMTAAMRRSWRTRTIEARPFNLRVRSEERPLNLKGISPEFEGKFKRNSKKKMEFEIEMFCLNTARIWRISKKTRDSVIYRSNDHETIRVLYHRMEITENPSGFRALSSIN